MYFGRFRAISASNYQQICFFSHKINIRFTNKVDIVTRGTSGIGLAIAKRLASEGARLVLADLDADTLHKALPALEAAGAPRFGVVYETWWIEAQVKATVRGTLQRFGRVDIIVNNAGLMQFKALETLTGEDWLRILSVDLRGAFYFTKQAFLHMKPEGSLVNVSSIHAIETQTLVALYTAAKAAMLSLTRSLALEGKSRDAVLPGAIDTPMLWNNPNGKSGAEKN